MATVYSQELFASQTEFLAAVRDEKSSPRSVVAAVAKTRLKLLGMSDQEIAEIVRQGQPRKFVTLQSPTSGVVLRRGVSAGASIDPSTEIAAVADLSRVWVWAEIPETASNDVATGSVASLSFPGAGADIPEARVEFVYPTLTERTRTLRVRFVIPNANGLLRPGLYGVAIFKTTPRDALLIPRDAIVDTGQSQHVFISLGRGHFEPRTVVLGARLADRVEVLQGLSAGDEIVAEGVFMLDSESRLRASSGVGTGHAGHGNATARAEEGEPSRGSEAPRATPHQGHGSQR